MWILWSLSMLQQHTWWPTVLCWGRKHRKIVILCNLIPPLQFETPQSAPLGKGIKKREHCVHLGWFHLLHPESKCWLRQDLYPAGIIYILCLSCTFSMLCPKQRKTIVSFPDFELLLPSVWIDTCFHTIANAAQELNSSPCLPLFFLFFFFSFLFF